MGEMESWIAFAFSILLVIVLCDPLTSAHPVQVNYNELQDLEFSCYPSDTCQRNETSFVPYPSSCDCDISCSLYDTCCMDSKFRNHSSSLKLKSSMKCLQVYNQPGFEIFMVDSCNENATSDNLCYSDPEDSNDPFLIIPVTSNVTGVTYKNYFCAVCNEEIDSEELHIWDVQISAYGFAYQNISEPRFKFDKTLQSWLVNDGNNNETSSVFSVDFKVQQNWHRTVKYCSSDLIENCSRNWTDGDVASKCKGYMAIVTGFQNTRYKNPHCGICNFENITNLECLESPEISKNIFVAAGPSIPVNSFGYGNPLIRLFWLKDRPNRCGRNMVYDKFADKCRCNSRTHRMENGKCVHYI